MNLRRPRLLTILLFTATTATAACSSPSDEPKAPAPQSGEAAQDPGSAAAAPEPVAPPVDPPITEGVATPSSMPSGCDGTLTNGILGSWSGTDAIPGESATGSVALHSTYRFCGAQAAGTFRLTADAQDSPHKGCMQSADLEGDFAVSGTTLVMTVKSGSGGTKDCPAAADNVSHTVSASSSRSYEMELTPTSLTLREVGQAADTAVTYQRP